MKLRRSNPRLSKYASLLLGMIVIYIFIKGYDSYSEWTKLLILGIAFAIFIIGYELYLSNTKMNILRLFIYLIPSFVIFVFYWYLTLIDVN